jgi:hypothetical protein
MLWTLIKRTEWRPFFDLLSAVLPPGRAGRVSPRGASSPRLPLSQPGLGLAEAEDAIRAQFGLAEQRAVRFSLRDFQQKFQDVFVRCQETGSRIDPGFLSLGLYLATLYEHLEALGEPLDVRAAFDAVVDRP